MIIVNIIKLAQQLVFTNNLGLYRGIFERKWVIEIIKRSFKYANFNKC
jgi:hypothetical protein